MIRKLSITALIYFGVMACVYLYLEHPRTFAADDGLKEGMPLDGSSAGHGQRFPLDPSVPKFVNTYCIQCHNSDDEKGDRNLEPFLDDPTSPDQHFTAEEILDQLNLGEMPPQKKSVKQPSGNEKLSIIAELTRYLSQVKLAEVAEASVLRRLTKYEYRYTIRDLLGISPEFHDATGDFPMDNNLEGFFNVGSVQGISDRQLELYLQAAREYLDLGLYFGADKPRGTLTSYKPEDFGIGVDTSNFVGYRTMSASKQHIDIGIGSPTERLPTYPKTMEKAGGVELRGMYRIRVKAAAMDRLTTPYDRSYIDKRINMDQSFELGLWHVPDPQFLGTTATAGRVLIETFELSDNEPGVYEATVWMPKGSIIFVNWMNGPPNAKRMMDRIMAKYHPRNQNLAQNEIDKLRAEGKPVPRMDSSQRVSDIYRGPRVRLFEIEMEGPLYEEWPPQSHQLIVGKNTNPRQINLYGLFNDFATKAFRRPVKREEVLHYVDFVTDAISSGASHEEGIKLGLKAVLASPRFLFLDEGNVETDGEYLNSFEFASRLSYAFWCSMPSDELFELAKQNRLTDEKALIKVLDNILDDPRSIAFVEHFADSWLRLDRVGSMPPARREYRHYYEDQLEAAMLKETHLFFDFIVRNDRPITDFLDANYTFVNEGLARHYGIEEVYGTHFRQVRLDDDLGRRGILGHASVLTATANGIETSPIVRGVWVLENILGTPPSPPPPDVPAIEPDVRGAVTIREQLAKHRQIESCNNCHQKIDPWGFALESYDPIGGYREEFRGNPIDPSSKLPNGLILNNSDDLKQALMLRRRDITKNLARKLLIYCTGRELTFRDEPELEQIVNEVARNGYGMRDLLRAVVTSDIIRRR